MKTLDKRRADVVSTLVHAFFVRTKSIKKLEAERREIREAIEGVLTKLGRDDIDTVHDGVKLRAQRYPMRRATYDVAKLGRLLKERGLGAVLEVRVNETKLMEAIERGLVSLEEVDQHAKVNTVFAFRVDEIKGEMPTS